MKKSVYNDPSKCTFWRVPGIVLFKCRQTVTGTVFCFTLLFSLLWCIISDFTDMEMKGSDLKHLVKDRARPPQKRRPPTRPSNKPTAANDSVKDENNEEGDIEVFWSKTVEE